MKKGGIFTSHYIGNEMMSEVESAFSNGIRSTDNKMLEIHLTLTLLVTCLDFIGKYKSSRCALLGGGKGEAGVLYNQNVKGVSDFWYWGDNCIALGPSWDMKKLNSQTHEYLVKRYDKSRCQQKYTTHFVMHEIGLCIINAIWCVF